MKLGSTLLAILIVFSVFTTIQFQSADALTQATFTDRPTFSSIAGNWEQVYTNSAGDRTYFLDSNGNQFRSVRLFNNGTIDQNIASTLVSEPVVASVMSASSTKNDIEVLQRLGGNTQTMRTTLVTLVAEKVATASSEIVGTTINEVHLWLKKTGAPTGTATIAVFNSVGTTVYSFGTQDVSLLTTSFVEKTYTGALTGRTLASGDYIGIFFNSGSAGNTLDIEYAGADRFDSSDTIQADCTGVQGAAVCTDRPLADLHMQLSFDYVAALTNDLTTGSSWENAGFVSRATQSASESIVTLRADTTSTSPGTISSEKKTVSSILAGLNVDTMEVRLSKTGSPTGTVTIAEFDNDGSAITRLDQAAGTLTDCVFASTTANACAEHFNSGAALVGLTVNSFTVGLKKTNSPTGTLSACVLDSSNTCVYTFGTFDISTLTTSYVYYTFANYDATHTIVAGEYIGVKADTQTGANTASVGRTTANVYDGALSAAAVFASGAWGADLTSDMGSSTANTNYELYMSALPTILNTFGTMDASALTTSMATYSFTISGADFTLSAGETTYVGIMFTGGNEQNKVNAQYTAVDAFDGTTNSHQASFLYTWADNTTFDAKFKLIDMANTVADQEAGVFIKADAGSSVATGAVRVYWSDASKIPQTVMISTSTDDITYTQQAVVSPTQAVGYEFLNFGASVTARYVKMNVTAWGSTDFSIQLGEFNRAPTFTGVSRLSEVVESGGVRYVVYSQRDQVDSEIIIGKINIDSGNVIGAEREITGGILSEIVDVVISKNKIYSIWRDLAGTSNDIVVSSWLHDLTSFTAVEDDVPIDNTAANGDCEIASDGATEATDSFYCVIGYAGAADPVRVTEYNGATIVVIATTADNTATNIELTDLSNKQVFRYVSAGTTSTFTITKSGDVVSAELFADIWLSHETQQFNFDGTTRTYKAGSKLYLATSSYPIAYQSDGTLIDPDTCYVETVSQPTATLTCIDDASIYRISDSLLVTAGGTTWTPRVVSGTMLAPTVYEENLNVALVESYEPINDGLITLQCDANYIIPARVLFVGSISDCSQWVIRDVVTNPIGREIPFDELSELVWAFEFTNYNIHVTLANGDAEDFAAHIEYTGVLVDRNTFDASDNTQVRLLYGQCYVLKFVEILSGDTVETSTICADDVIFKEAIISTTLGFSFWTLPWGGFHLWNETSEELTTVIRHDEVPYNYTTTVYNATGGVLFSNTTESNNEVDSQTWDLSPWHDPSHDPPASQQPYKVEMSDDGGIVRYSAWFDTGLGFLAEIGDGLALINFEGWGLLLFLPLVFAGAFTRSTASVGVGMVVALVGLLITFGALSFGNEATNAMITGLIAFIAVMGLLAYRQIYG